MVSTPVVVAVSLAYLGLLFGVAYVGARRGETGRSIVANPNVYALSLAVYATSWTYYGSVGRAATTGLDFLTIYLGPTIMAALWWVVLRKVIRICRRQRITSLSDFVASRYGKSTLLGAIVAVVAVVGIVPYIALQLKAISQTFEILRADAGLVATAPASPSVLQDTAFWVALVLAAFTIVFGTRHLDATERHEGMVAAIAAESVVKLVAFIAVGVFVTYGMFDGFGDVFARAAAEPELAPLSTLEATGGPWGWFWLVVLSMLAVLLLPRQFQVGVVENVDEAHVRRAMWLFPLYLLVMNLFVLPIALGGLLHFEGDTVDADTFVLALPLSEGQELLALVAFIGGLSAATGMVIVEAIALSTMVSNSLVMPALLRRDARIVRRAELRGFILAVRRLTIVALLLLGFAYFRVAGEAPALVSIGLVSFAAVAQFAPAFIGGLFWKDGTRDGALAGLLAGTAVWAYTLLLPSFARSGWLPESFLQEGPFGIAFLRPEALFGLEGLDHVSHAMTWSLLVNVGAYVGVSLFGRRTPAEAAQAALFVDALADDGGAGEVPRLWRGRATVTDLRALLERFAGPEQARRAIDAHVRERGADPDAAAADPELVAHVETLLAGAVGTVSARVMIGAVVEEEPLGLEEVMEILEEATRVRAHSRELERKSAALEAATAELRAANRRLSELDQLKDDFMSTVTHELRTPLTSIRALGEILLDEPDIDAAERSRFLETIVGEAQRLTRLINQVLDLAKLESGRAEWTLDAVDLRQVVADAIRATEHLTRDRHVDIRPHLPEDLPAVAADRDRLMQVMLNLLSNAVKFSDPERGLVDVQVAPDDGRIRVDVADNGPGIPPAERDRVFEKFRQATDPASGRPQGTGLGLPISREIVTRLGGEIWVESEPGRGARFTFVLPVGGESTPSRAGEEDGGDGEDPDR